MINLCNHLGHAPHVSRLGKSLGPTWLHLVALRHGNPLAAAAALLGVTGQSESNIGRVFRGPGVVLMMFDAFVAAGAVASPSSSLAAGSVSCRPKRSACGCLRGSRPGDFPDNFYLEALDRQHRRGRSLPASQGAWPPPGSKSMTLLLPCTHMLTRAALSHPHRSLASRRLQNYGCGSTTSRRAHAAAIISAPPRTARTAASCTRSQALSPGSSR
jgi:hypothetical protein